MGGSGHSCAGAVFAGKDCGKVADSEFAAADVGHGPGDIARHFIEKMISCESDSDPLMFYRDDLDFFQRANGIAVPKLSFIAKSRKIMRSEQMGSAFLHKALV